MVRTVFAIFFVLTVLGISVSTAFASEARITVDSDGREYQEGDIAKYEGWVYRIDPADVHPVTLEIYDRNDDNRLVYSTKIELNPEPEPYYDETGHRFSFEIDTNDSLYERNVVYDIIVRFNDAEDDSSFDFMGTPAQQVVESGKAIEEGKLKFDYEEDEDGEKPQFTDKQIPDWVRDVFIFYANGEIDDGTLIGTLEYLIKVEIIRV